MATAGLILKAREIKAKRIAELVELFKGYRVVGVVDLFKSSADLIHLFRHKLRGQVIITVAKKTLIVKAARQAGREKIAEYLEGHRRPMALIFTNMNPFLLKLELDKSRVLAPPRPNEVAEIDVVIPPINTGLQPGPILSEFGKMKIPTRIEGGTIWIARETTVAKKGDTIQPPLASLLAKLEIGAVYRTVSLLLTFDRESVITADQLQIDLEGTRKMLSDAHSLSLALAAEIGYATPETIVPILVKAHFSARALSLAAGYPIPENVSELLARAASQAAALQKAIDSRAAA
ncbi:MAG: 50S ribosomal protein L10 [Nitrososphaerota archaeon]